MYITNYFNSVVKMFPKIVIHFYFQNFPSILFIHHLVQLYYGRGYKKICSNNTNII